MTEPKLIKAGDKRVLLGYAKTPPKVDVRVITEDNYQELKQAFDLYNVVKSLPQDNYCNVCNLPTDGEKCYSKRCPV